MSTVGARVKAGRRLMNWSQADLGKKLGVSQAAISEIERDITKESSLIVPIAKLYGVDAEELLTGVKKEGQQQKSGRESLAGTLLQEGVIIPAYDAKALYGKDIIENDVTMAEPLSFQSKLLDRRNVAIPESLAVAYASGSGMRPTIEDGQTLLINTLDKEPQSSKVYLVCIGGRLFLKRFIYTPACWLLRSDNPDKMTYPNFEISHDDMKELDIQGRVVWRGGEM